MDRNVRNIDSNDEFIIRKLVHLALMNKDSRLSIESKLVLSDFIIDNVIFPSLAARCDKNGDYYSRTTAGNDIPVTQKVDFNFFKQIFYVIVSLFSRD